MFSLDASIGSLPKIGPKYKVLLQNLEIFTIEDLLYHFPFRYDDFSQIKKIGDLVEGEVVTVEAVMGPVTNIFTRNGKKLTRAKAFDYTGEIEIVWFNQHYIKSMLKTGQTYMISGKVGTFDRKLSFTAPELEEKSDNSLNTGRLVSIYPETAGVSSKFLRSRNYDVLHHETDLKEFLPEMLLKEKKLKEIDWCFNQIHFPDNITEATHAHRRFEFEELFLELLNVEKRKHAWKLQLKSNQMIPFEAEIKTFIDSLAFELTDSQKTSVQEVIQDLLQPHPMNRLLEGDVGTGKTIVAVIASYLAVLNGYKVLYMAPTEILANQHFETFQKLLPKEKVSIALKTSATSKTFDSNADIIIGTHAILFGEQQYEKVGLIIIDEQHRFGVEQRGKIVEMATDAKTKATPHLLTMTATPIPRTLALTLYGDLSISVLKTHPNAHRKITTKIIPESSREKAYQWIRDRNEPTFIVCPLIDESESISLENVKGAQAEFEKLRNGVFKDLEVGLLHGRMKPAEKQEVIEKFRKGLVKVLVSTPVIEVGIDVPDATVIVIESAERYGLASLHQLRGRVGRGDKEGFCFAYMSNNAQSSYQRLKYLEEIDNGLELAEMDMKLRGQGDVFGIMQHGDKRFRIASLDDLELLEEAKLEAQKYYTQLDKYPLLDSTLTRRVGKYISNN